MKKKIIILAALAVVSFVVSFGVSTYFGHNPNDTKLAKDNQAATTAPVQISVLPAMTPASPMAAKEKQLDDLVAEYHQKIDACNKKQAELEQWEKRRIIAQEMLKKQADDVEAMRVQYLAELPNLEKARRELEASRVAITAVEAVNLKKIAVIYDKMSNPSEGITKMCENNQIDDAVKILRFMPEKSAAKVLSDIRDKSLVVQLTARLSKIKEES